MKSEVFTRDKAILEIVKYVPSSSIAISVSAMSKKDLCELLIEFGISKNPIIK